VESLRTFESALDPKKIWVKIEISLRSMIDLKAYEMFSFRLPLLHSKAFCVNLSMHYHQQDALVSIIIL
jgi:hypothetical protein